MISLPRLRLTRGQNITRFSSPITSREIKKFATGRNNMANHKSAEKRIRQTTTRTAVNRKRNSVIRASLKKVEAAIAAGDKNAAQQALKEAQPTLMSGVSKGVVKLGTASRKMSRLSSRIKKLAA